MAGEGLWAMSAFGSSNMNGLGQRYSERNQVGSTSIFNFDTVLQSYALIQTWLKQMMQWQYSDTLVLLPKMSCIAIRTLIIAILDFIPFLNIVCFEMRVTAMKVHVLLIWYIFFAWSLIYFTNYIDMTLVLDYDTYIFDCFSISYIYCFFHILLFFFFICSYFMHHMSLFQNFVLMFSCFLF